VVIFSKNRPLQLHATLKTLFKYGKNVSDVSVITMGDQELYKQVQSEIEAEFRVRVKMIEQRNFYLDVTRLMNPYYSHLAFLVDDTVFYRPFDLVSCCQFLRKRSDVFGVSLRLGHNTSSCYMLKCSQSMHDLKHSDDSPFMTWNWNGSSGDFSYPMDLSSSVYRISDVQQLLSEVTPFTNPNTMEHYLHLDRKKLLDRCPRLASLPKSVAFSMPMNVTQEQFENRHAKECSYTIGELLRAFKKGQRMDTKFLDHVNPNAAHFEFRFALTEAKK